MKNLLENKVIKNRFHFIKSFNEKEWWYSGIQFDDCFIGISLIRSIFIDSTAIVFFDGKNAYPEPKKRKDKYLTGYYLKKNLKKTDEHSLVVESKNFSYKYYEIDNDPEKNGYKLEVKTSGLKKFNGGDIEVDLILKIKNPVFEKYDDYFENYYGLVNHFLFIEKGNIKVNGKEYKISAKDKKFIYQDHCFGNVPRKTKWNWAAVWNNKMYLDILINYGIYPQNYSEVLISSQKENWIRLNQDVSFEYSDRENKFNSPWKITSTDVDLQMEFLGIALEREAIPFSWCPLLINLFHYQCFAHVWGKILVNGKWVETGDLFGVFETHHGTW